eukprot:scaffold1036_cov93-Cylindrotheca_fusiformis.AAC.2
MGNLFSYCFEDDDIGHSNHNKSKVVDNMDTSVGDASTANTSTMSFDKLLEFHQQSEDDESPRSPFFYDDEAGGTMMDLKKSDLEKSDYRANQKRENHLPTFNFQGVYGAAKCGCARELFEETGIDLRQSLERFQPLMLLGPSHHHSNKNKKNNKLRNEHKERLFFIVPVSDSDFLKEDDSKTASSSLSLSGPLKTSKSGHHLKLRLSHEHTGFTFEKDPPKAIEMMQYHSGGKVSEALRMAFRTISSSKK